jgi:hypothetical protein
LPPATTAGQTLVLVSATNGFSVGFFARPGSGDHAFDYSAQDAAIATVGPFSTMIFVSDGNHNWFLASAI